MKICMIALAACSVAVLAQGSEALPVQYGDNGHYYEYISASVDFDTALAQAAGMSYLGMQGYLATVTSAGESAFVAALHTGSGIGSSYWLGGSDAASEQTWAWITGPEAGQIFYQAGTCLTFCNWEPGEPNNSNTENALHGFTWWNSNDTWNDLGGGSTLSYVVEYSAATVPVPAGMALLLSGLGGLAAIRRRRSRR